MNLWKSPVRFTAFCAATALLTATVAANRTVQELEAVPVVTPEEHRRGPEQTFLTLPEWFLVHSPAEYAAFIQENPPSEFPYFGHIKQFWQGYATVYNATKDTYPLNVEYHAMVLIISISTTVEYALKLTYETLIGRVTELTRMQGMTEEDVFAARIAQDYVDFLLAAPWYEYDFAGKLKELWTETNLWGPDPIRKWERKYALTTDYGAKAVYGWVLNKLLRMSSESPLPVTAVLLDQLPPNAQSQLPNLNVLGRLPDHSVLVTVPRYAAFKHNAFTLAKNGAQFLEIAGNRTVILVSVLVPVESEPLELPYEVLVNQPILTRPSTKRMIMIVPVRSLSAALIEFDQLKFQVEHVYDY